MQTNTSPVASWQPLAAAASPRASWPRALGWYVAGVAATTAAGAFLLAVAQVTGSFVAAWFGHVLTLLAVFALIKWCCRLPRRSAVAFVLGAMTPFVLAAAVFIFILWSFSHANLTF